VSNLILLCEEELEKEEGNYNNLVELKNMRFEAKTIPLVTADILGNIGNGSSSTRNSNVPLVLFVNNHQSSSSLSLGKLQPEITGEIEPFSQTLYGIGRDSFHAHHHQYLI